MTVDLLLNLPCNEKCEIHLRKITSAALNLWLQLLVAAFASNEAAGPISGRL
jgi:hypothetical protein